MHQTMPSYRCRGQARRRKFAVSGIAELLPPVQIQEGSLTRLDRQKHLAEVKPFMIVPECSESNDASLDIGWCELVREPPAFPVEEESLPFGVGGSAGFPAVVPSRYFSV